MIKYRLTAAACKLAAAAIANYTASQGLTKLRLNCAADISGLPYVQLYRHGRAGRFKLIAGYPIHADVASLLAFLNAHDAERRLCDRRHLRKSLNIRRQEIAKLQARRDAMKRWPHYDPNDSDVVAVRVKLRRLKYNLKRALAR